MILRSLSLLLALGPTLSFAENWPQWRGPRLDGTSQDTGFPVSADGTMTWKVELPGSGHASPIVWNDRLFIAAAVAESEQRVLICLDRATGKTLWQSNVLKAPIESIHRLNSQASSTPATDGERVFTAFLDNTETEATRKANSGRV
ncbi:MAG: PQQ-like beta-propeller repeat protein, partial [Verrucomicrobiaceae bacterium]|nr:PQQ-like beta-propeller repeat protein [Verrucomicrobiaceae bacterium]